MHCFVCGGLIHMHCVVCGGLICICSRGTIGRSESGLNAFVKQCSKGGS